MPCLFRRRNLRRKKNEQKRTRPRTLSMKIAMIRLKIPTVTLQQVEFCYDTPLRIYKVVPPQLCLLV